MTSSCRIFTKVSENALLLVILLISIVEPICISLGKVRAIYLHAGLVIWHTKTLSNLPPQSAQWGGPKHTGGPIFEVKCAKLNFSQLKIRAGLRPAPFFIPINFPGGGVYIPPPTIIGLTAQTSLNYSNQ